MPSLLSIVRGRARGPTPNREVGRGRYQRALEGRHLEIGRLLLHQVPRSRSFSSAPPRVARILHGGQVGTGRTLQQIAILSAPTRVARILLHRARLLLHRARLLASLLARSLLQRLASVMARKWDGPHATTTRRKRQEKRKTRRRKKQEKRMRHPATMVRAMPLSILARRPQKADSRARDQSHYRAELEAAIAPPMSTRR